VLISKVIGMSLRAIPPILLHIAYLIVKGKSYCSYLTRSKIAIKIRLSSFSLASRLG
jgi:hypothetical protein